MKPNLISIRRFSLILLGLIIFLAVFGARRGHYTTSSGLSLDYAIAKPLSVTGARFAIWVIQPGESGKLSGNERVKRYGFPLRYVFTSLVSQLFRVIVVWPQIRREYFSNDLKAYCELDFYHRIGDLELLLGQLKNDSSVDPKKILLVGFSAGSEIVTKVANKRNDIAAIATIGGGVMQFMDYLKLEGDTKWADEASQNQCVEGRYLIRGAQFWSQYSHSDLYNEIKKSKEPYLVIMGSEDVVRPLALNQKYLDQMVSEKKDFHFEIIKGMGHSPGFNLKPWKQIEALTNALH